MKVAGSAAFIAPFVIPRNPGHDLLPLFFIGMVDPGQKLSGLMPSQLSNRFAVSGDGYLTVFIDAKIKTKLFFIHSTCLFPIG